MEKDQRISERRQMPIVRRIQRNCTTPVVRMQETGRNGVLQVTWHCPIKVLAVKWAMENGLLPEGTKWYEIKWEHRKVIENCGKKLLWDWEHLMKTNCTVRRPDLMLENTVKRTIMLVDMACPTEANKDVK